MFSLFALKVGAAQLLNERTWRTWDRLRTSPAGFGEILAGKSLPILVAIAAQQAILFGFAAVAFGLHPRAGWWALAACAVSWSACVLVLGLGASTLARSPAQLSAAGDVFALIGSPSVRRRRPRAGRPVPARPGCAPTATRRHPADRADQTRLSNAAG